MKLNSYLSKSRHGLFYFRWPLPERATTGRRRTTLRLSLGTRCPKKAGEMARHLSSYSLSLSNCATFQTMRHDKIRDRIRQHFQRILDRQKERVHRDGPPSAE